MADDRIIPELLASDDTQESVVIAESVRSGIELAAEILCHHCRYDSKPVVGAEDEYWYHDPDVRCCAQEIWTELAAHDRAMEKV